MSADNLNPPAMEEPAVQVASVEASSLRTEFREGTKIAEKVAMVNVEVEKKEVGAFGESSIKGNVQLSNGNGVLNQEELCQQDDMFSVDELSAGGDHMEAQQEPLKDIGDIAKASVAGENEGKMASHDLNAPCFEETLVDNDTDTFVKEKEQINLNNDVFASVTTENGEHERNERSFNEKPKKEGSQQQANNLNNEIKGRETVREGILEHEQGTVSQELIAEHEQKETPILSTEIEMINVHGSNNEDGEPVVHHATNNEQDHESLIGRKVAKKFGRKKFIGKVVSFDPESKWFKVVYEDNDSEDLERFEVENILVPLGNVKTPSSRKRSISDIDGSESAASSVRKSRRLELDTTMKAKKESLIAALSSEQATEAKKKRKRRRKNKNLKKGTPKSGKGTSKGKSKSKGSSKATKDSAARKRKSMADIELREEEKLKEKKQKLENRSETVANPNVEHPGEDGRKSDSMLTEVNNPGHVRVESVNPYLGSKVKKDFGGKLLNGVVVGHTLYYRVAFDDGDTEDLSIKELMRILVPDQGTSHQ